MEMWSLSKNVPDARALVDARFVYTAPFNGDTGPALTFAGNARYLDLAFDNPAVAAVLITPDLADHALAHPKRGERGIGLHDAPRELFFRTHNRLANDWLSSLSAPVIDATARVAETARIHPGAVIGADVEIADFAVIGPGVHIAAGCYVGEGALVGVVGHFEQFCDGQRLRIAHAGRLRVGARCQILPGAIIQRDVYPNETHLGDDVSIGPGVRLGHGVSVGEMTTITGGCVVAGFTRIGARVFLGPGATVASSLTIGDDARVEIGSVVIKDVASKSRISGNFAGRHSETVRDWARRR